MQAEVETTLLRTARRLCPQSTAYFDHYFLPDALKVREHFGMFFDYAVSTEGVLDPVSHGVLAFTAASEVMLQMENTSYRYWGDLSQGDPLTAWALAAWRYLHVLPLGFVNASASIRISNGQSAWSPAHESFASFTEHGQRKHYILPSNRPLSGQALGYRLYNRFFGNVPNGCPMLENALADAFSDRPNPDNPLASAAKAAIRKTILFDRSLRLPYFWVEAINALFRHDATFVPLTVLDLERSQIRSERDAAAQLMLRVGPDTLPTEAPPQPEAQLTPQPNPVVIPIPAEGTTWSPQATGMALAQATEASAEALPSAHTPSTAEHEVSHLCERVLDSLQLLYRTANPALNSEGAPFHVFRGRLCMLWPMAIRQALELGGLSSRINEDDLLQLLGTEGYIQANPDGAYVTQFAIHPPMCPAPVGTMRLVVITRNIDTRLCPELPSVPDNPALRFKVAA